MRIGIAQINPVVGDIKKNKSLVIDYMVQGHRQHKLDLIIFPELMLTGYPPEDLLFRRALHTQVSQALTEIIDNSRDIKAVLGYPRKSGPNLYNSCAYIGNGRLLASYDKSELPNYGVFDEKRYFTAGNTPCLIDLDGISTALTICEDIWVPGPARAAADAGAKLLININASPFHHTKAWERRQVLKQRCDETGLPVIYVNLVGGQDELVFDGGSLLTDNKGEIQFQAPDFEAGLHIVEMGVSPNGDPTFQLPEYSPAPAPSPEQNVYQALVLAVKDYVAKNGFQGVAIGLSGGIDSALVTAVAVDALGPENVEVLLMPSRYTAQMSVDDSMQMAQNLNINYHILPIEQAFSAFTDILEPLFAGLPVDTTEENIQARCRGIILMAISNKSGKLVLTTGNKSEMAVGYATLYGDMVGGYAPIKDVPKLLVYRLARWRNGQSMVIPERIIERPPTAELRHDQKDEDTLPAYEILDPVLERYIELDQSPREIIDAGFDRDMVMRVTRLVDINEYKR
ncbi:MAG: NAD+ synthase, partial [Gammaproteobacteria bacterium]